MGSMDNVTAALQPVLQDLAAKAQLVEGVVQAEARQARVAQAMDKSGYGPTGPFRHAPDSAKATAREKFQAEDDAFVGELATDVEDTVTQLWKVMPQVEAQTMNAPSVVDVLAAKFPSYDTAPVSYVNAHLLDLQLESLLTPTVASLAPRAALETYQAALSDPTEPRQAALIRLIEAQLPRGFAADPTDERADESLLTLRRLVDETRQGRVPEALRAWRDAVGKAGRARQLIAAAGLKRVSKDEIPALRALIEAARG